MCDAQSIGAQEVDNLEDKVAKLEQQIHDNYGFADMEHNALAAQIEMLITANKELQLKLDEQVAHSKKIEKDAMDCCEFEMATELCDRLNQSPAQSLNKLKADVIREFASQYSEQSIMIHSGRSVSGFAEECANQLLKEGE